MFYFIYRVSYLRIFVKERFREQIKMVSKNGILKIIDQLEESPISLLMSLIKPDIGLT